MMVKLNLTIHDETVTEITKYAGPKNTSVYKIAESLFEKSIRADTRSIDAQKFIDKYAGSATISVGENLTKEIAKAMAEKYGYQHFL